jgi:hypothetical protein
MSWLAAGAAAVSIGSSLYGIYSAEKAGKEQRKALRAQGRAQQAAKYFAAKQMEQGAKQQQAIAQRGAYEEARKAELLQSRALAIAGASGAGASDPNVTKLLSDIAAEGQLNAATQLYNGDEAARALRLGAKIARWEGDQAKKGLNVEAGAVGAQLQRLRTQTLLDIAGTTMTWAANNRAPTSASTVEV